MTFIGPQVLYETHFRLLMLRLFPIKTIIGTGSPANSLEHATGIPKVNNGLEVGGGCTLEWTFFIYTSDTLFCINNGKNSLSSTNGALYVI